MYSWDMIYQSVCDYFVSVNSCSAGTLLYKSVCTRLCSKYKSTCRNLSLTFNCVYLTGLTAYVHRYDYIHRATSSTIPVVCFITSSHLVLYLSFLNRNKNREENHQQQKQEENCDSNCGTTGRNHRIFKATSYGYILKLKAKAMIFSNIKDHK
jgi:hypothetical protein